MLRKIAAISVSALMLLTLSCPVLAAPNIGLEKGGMTEKVGTKGGYETAVTDTTLSESVGKIIKAVLSIIGVLFFALTVYAGFLWMTAGGNEEQVAKAKGIMQMAVIGLVIILASYTITTFVVAKLAGATKSGLRV